jgi:hypothetical protein
MISLLFGIHCHQPVDNFKNVVDEIVLKGYKPFFEVANKYEMFKFSVHFSGWLLEIIKRDHKKLFQTIKKIAEKGQLEFFTGGFYEPVLSSIPSRDRVGQIEKLNDFIFNNFGQKPKGLWLTERVWDPSIVVDLNKIGIEYILVDDYHFTSVGFHKEDLHGYYITEQDGYTVKIFPIDQTLRYYTPFKSVDENIKYLRSIDEKGKKGAIIFDDGEKFGVWPKTYEWVYEKKWLENYIEEIISQDFVSFEHYSDFAKREKPINIAYLPTTSYQEMGEWALFSDSFLQLKECESFLKENNSEDFIHKFVKGSIWKNFFLKYPEANAIHKRTLSLSLKNKKDDSFRDFIYKAECNDVLWHGIFGGVYLPNLRDNAYSYIINADKMVENKKKIYEENILFDGYMQPVINLEQLKFIFNPKVGGALRYLDIKDKGINILNTMTRHFEGYHKLLLDNENKHKTPDGITTIHEMDLQMTEEIKNNLFYDWYERQSFIHHFTDKFDVFKLKSCTFKEFGDFANQPFEYVIKKDKLTLFRSGGFYFDKKYPSKVSLSFYPNSDGVSFEIDIKSECDKEIYYILEFNFHFLNNENVLLNETKYNHETEDKKFTIFSKKFDKSIQIEFDKVAKAAIYDVSTVSQSESGVDFTLQGFSVIFGFLFNKNIKINGNFIVKDVEI